jgi:hypothetical protein
MDCDGASICDCGEEIIAIATVVPCIFAIIHDEREPGTENTCETAKGDGPDTGYG